MAIAPARIRELVRATFAGRLSIEEAETIVELGQIAVDADGREDPDEIATFFAFGKAIYELTGMADLPTPTFMPSDDPDERMAELAKQLTGDGARALAYTVAYALTAADAEMAPAEDVYMERLRAALGLSEARARALATTITRTLA